jgi:membrane fusion protein, multidrug efflux system
MNRRAIKIGAPAAGVVVIAAVVAGLAVGGDDGGTAAAAGDAATTEIRTADIAERETVSGTLGFGDERAVNAQTQGTVTALADEGSTLSRGDVLYRVDDVPVRLMYGSTPAYRTLQDGVDNGPDVRQLEANLRAMGYDEDKEMTIDREFDSDTTNAVQRWQEDLGISETGRVDLGTIVFQPDGPRRVASHQQAAGASARPGQPVLTTTTTTRSVSVALDARRTELLKVGRSARVKLPSGRRVAGRVTEVAATATAAAQGGSPTIQVTVGLSAAAKVDELDKAPVDVEIASETKKDALVVPVTALLAVQGGGYGLEVVEGEDSTRIVAVDPGTFADGQVEITGEGITSGMTVVTAR